MAMTELSAGVIPDAAAYDALGQRAAATPALDLHPDRPVWIFGAGRFAQDVHATLLAARFTIRGFIETQPQRGEFLGLPVLGWAQVAPAAEDQLVIAIHNRTAPLDQLAKLARMHAFARIAYPWDIHRRYAAELGWRYWLSGPESLLAGLERLKALHARLADDESRCCLYRIAAFRLGLDDAYASFRHDLTQYFNPLTLAALPSRPISYIDGGAYDGASLLQLAACHPIAQAHLFEPDPENYRKLADRLQASPFPVHCLPLGLMNSYQVLSFAGGQGEGGNLSDSGNIHVACAALDDLIPNTPIDFIKLDVEGAEIAALRGACRLLERHRPMLAISLYHRPDDLWAIPEALDSLCPDYRLFIRQHYFNSFDCVLYAIPGDARP
ncbi:MAG: FkbM family methyltransferase [Betaproteobacteria bacterium]|nr:FkbM family methyltransferase [Betaproteobacteria bacterium]